MERRRFCGGVVGLGTLALTGCSSGTGNRSGQSSAGGNVSFDHGVASGDPVFDGIVLWTRVTSRDGGADEVVLQWVVARDAELADVVRSGSVIAAAAHDHTVHVSVDRLEPATTYHYRFAAGDAFSPVGRTRTLPVNSPSHVRLGLVSCSNFSAGYFTVYRALAMMDDVDAVVHLGDYIYEYGPGFYDEPAIARAHQPPREATTLADYRTRYAQYRRDPDLQELHRVHPVIAIWDDHEYADNARPDGAGNHQRDEGDWSTRRNAGAQAWREWLPTRVTALDEPIYRQFAFGDLADLIVLDTRMAGRAKAGLLDDDRPLLGTAQEHWLGEQLAGSVNRRTTWRLIGQQVMVAQLLAGGVAVNRDQWDGYPAARRRLLEQLDDAGQCVVLTGDIHCSFAFDLAPDPFDPAAYDPSTGAGAVAVEIVVPSVTAKATEGVVADVAALLATRRLPHLRWVDAEHHGFVVLDVDRQRVTAQWHHVASVGVPGAPVNVARAFMVSAGERHLVELTELPAAAVAVP
jgi:alkaline phosphatase D